MKHAPSQPETGKPIRYELTLTHEELDGLVSLLKHEIPERFWTGPCPEHFKPLIGLSCIVAGIKSRDTVGGYWCQNCSRTSVETRGGICRECEVLLKGPHSSPQERKPCPDWKSHSLTRIVSDGETFRLFCRCGRTSTSRIWSQAENAFHEHMRIINRGINHEDPVARHGGPHDPVLTGSDAA